VLAGHVHPVFILRGRARQRLRLPCFLIDEQVSLLPHSVSSPAAGKLRQPPTSQVYLAGAGRLAALRRIRPQALEAARQARSARPAPSVALAGLRGCGVSGSGWCGHAPGLHGQRVRQQ
jgi:hypothetical protein